MPAGGRSSFQTMEHSSSSRGRAGLPPGTATTRLGTAMRPGTGGADGAVRLLVLLLVLPVARLSGMLPRHLTGSGCACLEADTML